MPWSDIVRLLSATTAQSQEICRHEKFAPEKWMAGREPRRSGLAKEPTVARRFHDCRGP